MRQTELPRDTLSVFSILCLTALLLLPVLAAFRVAAIIPGYVIPAIIVGFSVLIYFIFAHDKKNAQASQWRVPETSLHLYELLGGWPGSFIAQRRFRHKISKASYQFTFWTIVFTYQLVTFDFLNDWKYSNFVAEHVSHR